MPLNHLPNPNETYFFRSPYLPEAIHNARKEVAKKYPDQPIVTIVDGDFRGKDSFSLRCVDIEAELAKGTPAKEVLSVVDTWSPIKRRDMHADDINPSISIQYEPKDTNFLDLLIQGEKPQSLSKRAAQRAKHQLEKNGPPKHGRVKLSDTFVKTLGTLEQGDVSASLTADKKKPVPSVHSTQNIWHYLKPNQQKQYAQNIQDTQAEGSYLILGMSETLPIGPNTEKVKDLPDLFQRHGYTPIATVNQDIQNKTFSLMGRPPFLTEDSPLIFVYQKQTR